MNTGFLVQFAASLAAVAALVALAAWARIPRPTPPLDEAGALKLFGEEFPGHPVDHVWTASDGLGALARSGDLALVISRLGDAYVARSLPWGAALAGRFQDGRLRLDLGEMGAPRASLALDAWPPTGAGA